MKQRLPAGEAFVGQTVPRIISERLAAGSVGLSSFVHEVNVVVPQIRMAASIHWNNLFILICFMLVLSANLRKKSNNTNVLLKKHQKTWGSTSLSHINTLSQQPQSKTCKTKQRLPQREAFVSFSPMRDISIRNTLGHDPMQLVVETAD